MVVPARPRRDVRGGPGFHATPSRGARGQARHLGRSGARMTTMLARAQVGVVVAGLTLWCSLSLSVEIATACFALRAVEFLRQRHYLGVSLK